MSRHELIRSNLEVIERQLHDALLSIGRSVNSPPRLVCVSKLKPDSDIKAAYDCGYRYFGENYIQELVEKSKKLPGDIQWRFIGTLQSNKCEMLAAIPNLNAVETLCSIKQADLLSKHLPESRTSPLDVYLQINTSNESSKGGLQPIPARTSSTPANGSDNIASFLDPESPLVTVARHIRTLSNLQLKGLMTIGSIEQSLSSNTVENSDFSKLVWTRDALEKYFENSGFPLPNRLELSMGMSADYIAAIKSGSDNIRVGSSIFGERMNKDEAKNNRVAAQQQQLT